MWYRKTLLLLEIANDDDMMGMIETFIYTQSYNLANTLHIVAVVSDSYQK